MTQRFPIVLLVSVLLHALLIGLWFSADYWMPARPPMPQITMLHVVKLGKKRDKTMLPRKSESEPETAAEKAEVPQHTPLTHPSKMVEIVKKKPAVKVADQKAHKNKIQSTLKDALKKLNKVTDEGDAAGSAWGNELEGEMTASYNDKIQSMVRESSEVPSILTEDEKLHLQVIVRIFINKNGKLLKVTLEKKSRNRIYDNAVLMGTNGIDSFGPPPFTWLKSYGKSGVAVQMCPIRCE